MRVKPRKFIRGAAFKTLDAFAAHINGGGWVYIDHKIYHPGWARSFQFGWVAHRVHSGRLVAAMPNPAHPDNALKLQLAG